MFWSRRNVTWVTDDRGVKHSDDVSPRDEDIRERVQRRTSAAWQEKFGHRWNKHLDWRDVLMILLPSVAGIIATEFQDRFGGSQLLRFAVAFVLVWLGCWPVHWLLRHKLRAAEQQGALIAVEEGACGVCWYDLRGLKAGDDGMVVCPECEAAWLATRIRDVGDEARGSTPRNNRPEPSEWSDEVVPIRDQHDKVYSLVSIDELRRRIPTAPDPERERLEDGIKVMRASGRWKRWGIGALVAFFGVCALGDAFETIPPAGFGVADWAERALVLVVGIALLGGAVFWLRTSDGTNADAKHVLLVRSLCPACGGSLTDLPIDAKGNKTCAGCGGVWPTPWKRAVWRCPSCKRGAEHMYANAKGNIVCSGCGKTVEG